MPTPPVVMISFNRPQLTERTLQRVREVRPSQLFLVCDGPREGHPTDAARCAAVREVLSNIDWPCEVHRKFADRNGGCDKTIETGLDWVFAQVPHAIVLEDDCVPDVSFFQFCEELLTRYADDERVAQIAGCSLFVEPRFFGELSYAFAPYVAVWGWATWARAWQAHRAIFPRTHEDGAPRGPLGALPERIGHFDTSAFVTAGGRRYFNDVRDQGEMFNWDSHWWLSTAAQGQLCISPAANMVANVGFGVDATHVHSTRKMPPAEPARFPLVHPHDVVTHREVARELEHALVRGNGRLMRKIGRFVPHGRVRTFGRIVLKGPLTVWAMRQIARISAARRAHSPQKSLTR